MMNMNMKKENYFRNFKRIGIAAILAVAAAALFVGCADGNSRPSTTNAAEIRVEIDAQNLRLIDNRENTVAITIRTVPALSTIAELGNADTISLPIVIDGAAAERVEKSEGGDFKSVVPKEEIPITISTTATSKTITLRVHPDSIIVDDSFTIRIGTLTLAGKLAMTDDYTIKVTGATGTTLPSNKELTVTVIDSERRSINAQVNPASLVEGAMGNLELTLNNPPSGDVAVTASVGNDIPLTLDGGKSAMRTLSTTTTISIPIASIDNNQNEADASYTITIETTTAEVVVVHPMLTLTVTDDDIPQLSISPNIATIEEGRAAATFTITASTAPYRDIMVGYTIDGTGGADAADYTDANNGMATIRKGTLTASINISAVDDALPNETSEGLTLTLGTITPEGGAAIDTSADSAAITIRDNDGTDMDLDGIIDANDRCSGVGFATGWRSTAETDADRDGCRDSDEDIDDDGDGLIEINTLSQLNNMRYNLAGTSYREAANTTPITIGAPIAPTENCTTTPLGGEVYLCGYELMSNLDFDTNSDGTWNTTALDLDIDDHNAEYFPITTATATGGWLPIGSSADKFNAIFEGNDHTIANLAIRRDQVRIGLFGEISTAAHIRNIGLTNYLVDYTGNTNFARIGSLVGSSNGTISASYAHGSTYGDVGTVDNVGGLVGYQNSGIIHASYATVSVYGGDSGGNSGGNARVGGLVGWQNGGTISASYAIVIANSDNGGNDEIGGLVGRSNGTIVASYAIVTANGGTGLDDKVGGLVGFQEGGIIIASYATGTANGGDGDSDLGENVGGLVGWQNGGTISASYASVTADGGDGWNKIIGGLVGRQDGEEATIVASYATGRADGSNGNSDNVGGLVGLQNKGTIIASYASGTTDGGAGNIDNVGGLVGWQNDGSVIASYASGTADGGAGSGDNVGKLIGFQATGPNGGTATASYGFGDIANEENSGISPALPPGVTTPTELTEENAGSCSAGVTTPTKTGCEAEGNDWTSWNAQSGGMNAWDFGDNTQKPALRFADYDGTDYCGTDIPDKFADGTRIICGNNGSLIPGQGR